jgi:hypothetical protein
VAVSWLYGGRYDGSLPLAAGRGGQVVAKAPAPDDRPRFVKVLEQFWGEPNTALQVLEFVAAHD